MNHHRAVFRMIFIVFFTLIVGVIAGFFLYTYLHSRYELVSKPITNTQKPEQVVERIVSSAQLWRPVQEKVKDTVVQIFAQVAEIDLLQPYKTPGQGSKTGTGFIINEQGDVVTNAHVIDQAKSIWIQIPSLGKRIIDVELVGISPDQDLALLRIKPENLAFIKHTLGKIPFLPLGDSDTIRRSDEVLALGYPLSQQSLKSTTGVVSGRESDLIQTSAALNPGNSGGPLLNSLGQVIGVNEANVPNAQNVGYAIPINDVKRILPDLYKIKLMRKPFLGVIINDTNDALAEYLGNPLPGGCYVVEVVNGSTLEKAGVQRGDMIYEINGYRIDVYGEMSVSWSEDKISIIDFVSHLSIGQDLHIVVYRKGKRKDFKVKLHLAEQPAIHKIYPGYEDIDYEAFAGMVVMQLTINHIYLLGPQATGLGKFAEFNKQNQPTLVITHIFPSSQVYRTRAIMRGSTINEVNGIPVHTLAEYRAALKESARGRFLIIRASDNVARTSDNMLIALEWTKILDDEPMLSRDYRYPLGDVAKELLQSHKANEAIPVGKREKVV